MKYTLLELTQAVLSSMDSDEVNSINDTPESQQVVEVIKTVYDDIITRGDLQTHKTLFNLSASSDPAKPIMMTKPLGIDRIEWLRYNVTKDNAEPPVWADLHYLPIHDFVEMMHSYNRNETNMETFVHAFDGFTIEFIYRNDIAPYYYTTYDDNTLFFDAYDFNVDTTLQASKTIGYGCKATTFVKDDSWVPELQPNQFALLLNESKSLAWAELKQTVHAKAERTAIKNWQHLQRTRQQVPDSQLIENRTHNFNKLPNFARPR